MFSQQRKTKSAGNTALYSTALRSLNKNEAGWSNNNTTVAHHFGNMPVYDGQALQPKLSVNAPADKYEQEADAMAGKVVQGYSHASMTGEPLSTHISPVIQTKGEGGAVDSGSLSNTISASQGRGNAIDGNTRSQMSGRFGTDFSNVKIHTDTEAAVMSQQLNARAFTVGNDIYFNSGEYKPGSTKGDLLLAHELVHTVQQGGNDKKIQKEDKKPTPEGPQKPEVDFQLIPPDLKFRFKHLLFEADTSQVQFDYQIKGLRTSLAYKYGGPLSLKLKSGDFGASAGWTPGDNKFNLGLSKGKFSAGLSATPGQSKYGLGLHFGDKLLPMQDDMSKTFSAGGMAGANMMSGLSDFDDPMAYYNAHKSDIEDISKSVDLFKDITEDGKKIVRFGADVSATYDPVHKFVLMGRLGMRVMF